MTTNELITILENRFNQNSKYHENISWEDVKNRLNDENLKTLMYMEETNGEPDIIGFNQENNKYIYCDTSKESPNRRSLCYDIEALNSRKANKPISDAVTEASNNNLRLLTEEEYFYLQSLGDFDLKTSSWLHTPSDIRELKGSIFGDKRYGRTFIYHNGAESYYSSRGFRGILEI